MLINPEIFIGRVFEIFLYGMENLGGGVVNYFLNSKLKKISKKGRDFVHVPLKLTKSKKKTCVKDQKKIGPPLKEISGYAPKIQKPKENLKIIGNFREKNT